MQPDHPNRSHRRSFYWGPLVIGGSLLAGPVLAQDVPDAAVLTAYRDAALAGGDAARGKAVLESEKAGCAKCHVVSGTERRAGPDLLAVGDKFAADQLIASVLEPSATIHPDYGAIVVSMNDGRVLTGVARKRASGTLELIDAEAKLHELPIADIESEQKSPTSLMPAGIHKSITSQQFADLIAYLATLRQPDGEGSAPPGLVSEIPLVRRPVRLVPLHAESLRFDHPVCALPLPGSATELLVVEQMTRRIWRLIRDSGGERKELFVDLSGEAISGQFEGLMCLALHPQYLENGKYYVNYHVREDGIFSPVIAERQAAADRRRDSGMPSRRLLRIKQDTDLHWGGMIAFGPDGYLYIGAGDGGPQEDPDGNGQNLGRWLGAILRIDVDGRAGTLPYAIPETNPYRDGQAGALPEIWASGFRMPWRFSFDGPTGDLWVGDIGQNLFEEVTIARLGENHGWNVYEGFMPFSQQFRRSGEVFTSPVMSYRRKHGVSVTGGYVYRGQRSPSYEGVYVCGDFESKRIWALTQKDRQLLKMRQVGDSPEKISSFGMDAAGELLLVGYEGTLFHVVLDDSTFE